MLPNHWMLLAVAWSTGLKDDRGDNGYEGTEDRQ